MRKIILFFSVLIFSLLFLFLTVVNSLGHNIVSPSKATETYLKILMPQEWGFYSKNPKTLDLAYISVDGNEVIQPNANLKTIWGINRGARAQGTEAGLLYTEAQKNNQIKSTEKYFSEFIEEVENEPFVKMKNKDSRKTFKGRYILFSGEIVPFPWAKSTKDKYIVKKYVKVEVE
ncbi:TPA: SdpA family antimicrobial peptide system protein [Staphylococcus pseudintermedius]|nr:SdpA family antimicrobial peptide system protein [Staphylococcus pseudintermedius]EJA1938813.1 SdpA family antimicrobial peptide system protein [Staphylococcus pseudintermedius]EJG0090797.1 SdpA family antimicrobial peptide system protein [Staphylococcus pseudintermedius]HAR6042908.1 SdpA family antimicrobial peptide system protein [Staphylococcus pseudintermedius]